MPKGFSGKSSPACEGLLYVRSKALLVVIAAWYAPNLKLLFCPQTRMPPPRCSETYHSTRSIVKWTLFTVTENTGVSLVMPFSARHWVEYSKDDKIRTRCTPWLKVAIPYITQRDFTPIAAIPAQCKPPNDDTIHKSNPPKVNPSEIKVVYQRCTGGEVAATSALAPKIGPLGLSPKKVNDDIAKATGD
ncbi:hypothetical protein P7K49_000222 [Saguinus oedipus]|uniref:Large ribosomal subunit protein uL11 N-terminal domain-containing protein n=1 Tax=Saguinus oedipus TaxID=9490 RepID=A0ABQ9WBV8_SAGOE|nr:hypothetical protein P7K49_000222 [Saguinus oedipus]